MGDDETVGAGGGEQAGLGGDGEERRAGGGEAVGGPWRRQLELLGALGALAQRAES